MGSFHFSLRCLKPSRLLENQRYFVGRNTVIELRASLSISYLLLTLLLSDEECPIIKPKKGNQSINVRVPRVSKSKIQHKLKIVIDL